LRLQSCLHAYHHNFLESKVESFKGHHKKHELTKVPVSSLCEATENELKGSGMAISKKSSRVLKVTDVEKSSTSDFKVEV
jgi:hypothetical protein